MTRLEMASTTFIFETAKLYATTPLFPVENEKSYFRHFFKEKFQQNGSIPNKNGEIALIVFVAFI